jgi:hypothetical protein
MPEPDFWIPSVLPLSFKENNGLSGTFLTACFDPAEVTGPFAYIN